MEQVFNKESMWDRDAIRAIVGLGNPGQKYSKTRHNIGFRIVDELATRGGATWQESSVLAHATIQNGAGQSLFLVKPLTFMNSSGNAMSWLTKKGIKAPQILVVHDELEKPFGKNSIKQSGSARGHNGLRSLIGVIGEDFWRLRFGIGRPPDGEVVGDFVLQPFNMTEENILPGLIDAACRDLL